MFYDLTTMDGRRWQWFVRNDAGELVGQYNDPGEPVCTSEAQARARVLDRFPGAEDVHRFLEDDEHPAIVEIEHAKAVLAGAGWEPEEIAAASRGHLLAQAALVTEQKRGK